MKRISSLCLCVFVVHLLPLVAHAAPPAKEIVNKAIKAVLGTSYEAQMKFISQVDGNALREVKLYHLAPDLYRCEPLDGIGFLPGEALVENASELVRIGGGQVMTMPRRQFAVNDALTIKFLRDLAAKDPKPTVLSGRVGKYETWMLRQDMVLTKPYIITVGIDKKTWFPLFLAVIDGQGRARVYYEIEDITYRKQSELKDSLFEIPEAAPLRMPFAPEGGGMLRDAQERQPLPLFPGWLPSSYRVESLSLLRCPHGTPGQDCSLVYQLEAYGPQLDDLVSIFQMQSGGGAQKSIAKLKQASSNGYVVAEKNGWVIAVFGDLPPEKLKKIATGLERKPEKIQGLLDQTQVRDVIMDELRKQQ